eukprot:COSAG02_NODE_4715_length_5063_cov_2.229452_4_plen_173_part_00
MLIIVSKVLPSVCRSLAHLLGAAALRRVLQRHGEALVPQDVDHSVAGAHTAQRTGDSEVESTCTMVAAAVIHVVVNVVLQLEISSACRRAGVAQRFSPFSPIFAPAVFLPPTAVSRPAQSESHVWARWNAGQAVPASMRADGASLGEPKRGGGDQRDRTMQPGLQNSACAGS